LIELLPEQMTSREFKKIASLKKYFVPKGLKTIWFKFFYQYFVPTGTAPAGLNIGREVDMYEQLVP